MSRIILFCYYCSEISENQIIKNNYQIQAIIYFSKTIFKKYFLEFFFLTGPQFLSPFKNIFFNAPEVKFEII